jgi:hypothetical protein
VKEHWSPRALDVLRTAPVLPRGRLAPESPTREVDDELYELTDNRGLPILNGIALGYPSTLDVRTTETGRGDRGHCVWGTGWTTIYLTLDASGIWWTLDLGTVVGWRIAVEVLALEHSYRSWLPPLACTDARRKYPLRWGKYLAVELELPGLPEVEDVFADESVVGYRSTFVGRNLAAFTRLLEACRAIEFNAYACVEIDVTPVDDLEAREQEPGWRPMIEASPPIEGVSFDRQGEEAIRQVQRFQGKVVEILEVSPTATRCFRAPVRAHGSPGLNACLRQRATMVTIPKPTIHASAPMLEALASIEALGTFLFTSPRGFNYWIGLWPLDALPRFAAGHPTDDAFTCSGSPSLSLVEWPLYRWGDLEMVAIAGVLNDTIHLCDPSGAIWSRDDYADIFMFDAGNITSWLERLADPRRKVDDVPEGPILEIPSTTPWELPEHLGVPFIEVRSDARWKSYQSSTYLMWAMLPPRGVPSVSFKARSASDAVRAVAWAKEHWGTPKVAVTRPYGNETDQLTAPIEALGVTVIDGEQGGWHSEAFWERDK